MEATALLISSPGTSVQHQASWILLSTDGDGVTGRSIPHQLASTPGLMMLKSISAQGQQLVWSTIKDYWSYEKLNFRTEIAQAESYPYSRVVFWDTEPDPDCKCVLLLVGKVYNSKQTLVEDYMSPIYLLTRLALIKCGKVNTGSTGTAQTMQKRGFKPGWLDD